MLFELVVDCWMRLIESRGSFGRVEGKIEKGRLEDRYREGNCGALLVLIKLMHVLCL
jgi:hypothetical protein